LYHLRHQKRRANGKEPISPAPCCRSPPARHTSAPPHGLYLFCRQVPATKRFAATGPHFERLMMHDTPSISVLVPVYNESRTIATLLSKLHAALAQTTYEVIIVDDGSTDGTPEAIERLATNEHPIRLVRHGHNQGKGAALRTALDLATGQIIVIQDADLEYDPAEIPKLVAPILDGHADVVFGSRFHGPAQRVHLYWHRLANSMLTWLSNMFNNLDLSDMETGYKALRKSVADQIHLRENRFGVEPELTAKIARLKCRIYEVPISYYGRDYAEGKKIGFRDALRAAWCIVRYRIAD
jgi:glycosyltransferase involved in cell wall biosynthesis